MISKSKRAHGNEIVRVRAYRVWRVYGGPEEGGWWYDQGEVIASRKCRRRHKGKVISRLKRLHGWESRHNRFSVLGGDDFVICVEEKGWEPAYNTHPQHYC